MTKKEIKEVFSTKGFDVFEYKSFCKDADKNVYLLYSKDSSRSFDFFGSVIIKGKKYTHADSEFTTTDLDELISHINSFNSMRFAPSYLYCPITRSKEKMRMAFEWYGNKVLGLTNLLDGYDRVINTDSETNPFDIINLPLRLNLKGKWDDDDITGSVSINKSYGKWVQVEFTDMDSMFDAINTLIEPFLLINCVNSICVIEKMSKGRKYDDVEEVNANNIFNPKIKKMKNTIKEMLNNALDKLNES